MEMFLCFNVPNINFSKTLNYELVSIWQTWAFLRLVSIWQSCAFLHLITYLPPEILLENAYSVLYIKGKKALFYQKCNLKAGC